MKTFQTVTAALLLAAGLGAPLGAQILVETEGITDPSNLGSTVVLNAEAIGDRVARRITVTFQEGPLTLRTIRINGSNEFSYELDSLTRVPAAIRGDLKADMFLIYQPRTPGPARATLEFTVRLDEVPEGAPQDRLYSIPLVGQVPDFTLSYTVPGRSKATVQPEGSVTFGNRPVTVTTEATVTLVNTGSAPGTINALSIDGPAFSLLAPPVFPARVEPGAVLSLQLGFTPGTTGNFTSNLLVDAGLIQNRYSLLGVGGDELSYSLLRYRPGSDTGQLSTIRSGVPIVFGQSARSVELIGTNRMQSSVLLETIRARGPFAVRGIPPVPTSLGPGESIRLAIEPLAATEGQTTGELVIDDAVFPLELNLPPLRNVRLTTLGRLLSPGEQVSLGVALAVPYPVDIRGSLRLELDSLEAASDPALQWAAGGREVPFSIPAGQTRAVFAGNSSEASFQASTVSGTVRVLASFAAEAWGIDITPPAQPTLEFTVRLQPLPEVRFSRGSGQVGAGDAVALGLAIASAYPEGITGVLRLAFDATDLDGAPGSWQGVRQVGFTIPQGSTSAVFGGTSDRTTFSAPAASGTLTINAHFQADESGSDLTPDPTPELKLTVTKATLPEVSFSREGGAARAGESVSLGLALAEGYRDALVGTLHLSFAASDVDGASGPWAGAGRQVSFTIPAGSLSAQFGGRGTRTEFTMPAAEGRLTVTARFQTEDGGADVTPDPAPELAFDVGIASIPQLRFTTGGGDVTAGSGMELGLSLSDAYAETLAGTLTLAFAAADVDGASGPWAGAGRQVAFRIPAGSTAAEFGGAGNLATEFTLPSAEGRLTVTARLRLEDAGADVTPDPAPQVAFDVTVAALPSVSFSHEGGAVSAGTSMDLGLSLAAPYGEDLAGALTLAFAAADVDGASGPWAGAGRRVAFRIPAGSTAAEFGGAGNMATEFTLPSAEGRLSVTATLRTESGGVDVTPDPAPEVAFSVEVASLPAVSFSHEGGEMAPGAGVVLGLSLAEPYSETLAGTLAMAFAAGDVDGASGPWAGAGRQVAFRIPAGSTAAEFGAASNTVTEFALPSAKGRVTVTARLRTEDSGVDLTPDPAPEVAFSIEVAQLPGVTFSRDSGSVMPGATVDLGLSLAEAYPADISGSLALAFAPADAGGSAGGWSGAGRQVAFTIPEGTTEAQFGGGGTATQVTTPTVSGYLTVHARFRIDDGGVDITPASVPELELTVEAPALPPVSFSHQGGTVDPAAQVELQVSLESPYASDIVGGLVLTVETRAFTQDPSVQWATGGRQAWFTIPAGSTAAVFTGLSTVNAFQTGTVAGEIVMRAQFFAVPDGIAKTRLEQAATSSADITPDVIPEVRFGVMESAPVLQRIALGQTGQGGFGLQVTGYVTNRMVDSMTFAFTGATGTALSTKELVADVSDAMRTYFGGNQSTAAGGNFTATIAFSMDEGVFEDLAAVSVTASNALGTSNAVSLALND